MNVEPRLGTGSVTQSAKSESPSRNAHLDFLRSIAIVSVIVFHVVQMGPFHNPSITLVTEQGQYGVDLFFVLSGWLIGGLYWRERLEFGNVEIGRFVLRRWVRTIPPYLAALLLAWLAVFLARREPFSVGYLYFAQNYFPAIPFFLVSWSLCVEEHFYVLAPVALWLAARRPVATHLFFGALVVLPCAFRFLESSQGLTSDFGYQRTATHLRLEGLAAGFWLAYVRHSSPHVWAKIRKATGFLVYAAIGFLLTMMFLPDLVKYRFGLLGLSLSLAALLVNFTGRLPGPIVGHVWVRRIALSSYSVYLTHALMIHVARELMSRASWLPSAAYYPLAILLIGLAGAAFYLFVERTSISLRDRLVPKRRA